MASIAAVCVVHEVLPDAGRIGRTAIDKRPVSGPVLVGAMGVSGDVQVATDVHGGVDRAVYAYATEDAMRWAEELGRDLPPGSFGENL
ncbi:MAG: MOSC domain-containing protein, partial [Angustibacter sp.]